jgi:hypothetical protein
MSWGWLMWIRSSWPPGWNGDLIGYVASGLVLLTFTMKSMRPLRVAAILSNFAFVYYAIVAGMTPILILHAVLLPMNVVRLMQLTAPKGTSVYLKLSGQRWPFVFLRSRPLSLAPGRVHSLAQPRE